MADRKPKGPIFIVGSMGSGTTLMRLILDSHENIAIAQETTFMRGALAHKWIPFWLAGGEWYERIGYTEQELDRELEAFYDRLFTRFATQQGKQRWGDKSPHHVWQLREAAQIFPDAVFIATVRHPGAVASSLHYRFRWYWPKSVMHWLRSSMELAHRAADLGERMILCRYEDLVLDAEATLREVLEWLDEPWSPQVMEHHVVQGERGTGRVEGKTVATDPIDAARVAKWAETMSDDGYRMLRKKAGPLARFYGYEIDDATAFAPLVDGSGPRRKIITGTELMARREQFPDVRWGFRPKPIGANQMLRPGRWTVVPRKRVPKRRVPRELLDAERSGQPVPMAPPIQDSSRPPAAGGRKRRRAQPKTPLDKAKRAVASRLPDGAVRRLRQLVGSRR